MDKFQNPQMKGEAGSVYETLDNEQSPETQWF
jgi:hypothetical protein